ncbi:hypothetical protein [Cohnella mopanensis]|uniref:hypothetical protein n=1 Tax=Cohnella mopanensis TaxID=2911966 RepID=UPI001EF7C660|nr:hypothetical protein [Cohnella mopanensis]
MIRVKLAATIIRRIIIIVFAILLLPRILTLIPDNRGDKENIKALEKDGPVVKYDIHQSMLLDQDRFTVNEIYSTPKQVVLRYTYRPKGTAGWSLPENAFKLYDSSGNELRYSGSSSSGTPWGSTGFINYSALIEPTTSMRLVYDWYDRNIELTFPIQKEGEEQ